MKPIQLTLGILCTLLAGAERAGAQAIAFTYQGVLSESGAPATGLYDFRFTLFEAMAGGNPVGGPLTNAPVLVSNGLFTVMLDFGAGVFTGAERWLEIGVRSNGSAEAHFPLSPRQQVTSAPYAVRAAEAGTAVGVVNGAIDSAALADGAVTTAKLAPGAVTHLGAPDGSPGNAVQVNNSGLVGLGTTAPQAGLHIATGAPIYGPNVLFQVRDGTGSYTNLSGAIDVAASGSLLAVAARSDNAVLLIQITPMMGAPPILRSTLRDSDGVFTNLNGAAGLAFSGNLLAIAAQFESAVTLVDVSNPNVPVKRTEMRDGVGAFNGLQGASAVAFSGSLLAIAGRLEHAVTLVDVSDPANPLVRSVLRDGVGFNDLAGPVALAFSGSLLAVSAQQDNAVSLIDVSSPMSPILRATLKDGVGGFTALAFPLGVAFSGNLLAITSVGDNAASLVDVTDPTNPTLQSVVREGVNGVDSLAQPGELAFSGNLLAVTSAGDSAVTLFDVSSPSNPIVRGVFRDGLAGVDFLLGLSSVAFHGTNLVVTALGDSAFSIIAPVPQQVGLVSSGWVGIGTAVPSAPLHVKGNVVVENATVVTLRAERTELGIGSTATGFGSAAIGQSATASGPGSTGLGVNTTASGSGSTAIGNSTVASGDLATAMGFQSTASGRFSLAAGNRAKANHDGAFVWADSQQADFASTATNELSIRASGGVRLVTSGAGLTIDGQSPLIGLVGSAQIQDGAVTSSKLAGGAVTAGKIAAQAVGTAELSDNAVGPAQLANDPASLAKVSAGIMSVINGNIGIGVAATQKLAAGGIIQSTSGGFQYPDGTVQTTAAAPGAIPNGMVEFSSVGSNSFIVPAGITRLLVEVWGAGGGGGGGDGSENSGSGGGSGGYSRAILSVTPGADYTVVIGAGGVAGPAGSSGGAGGSSRIQTAGGTTLVFANGGSGGGSWTGGPGAGGSGDPAAVLRRTGITGGARAIYGSVEPLGVLGGAGGQNAGMPGSAGYVLIQW